MERYKTSESAVVHIWIDVGCFEVGIIFNVLPGALCVNSVDLTLNMRSMLVIFDVDRIM